jgi:hypothetical protein
VPRERLLVVRTEELNARYPRILDFLGLPPAPTPTERHTRRPAAAPELPPDLRARLDREFAADQAALAALL